MTQRRKRDRQTRGGHASSGPVTDLPKPPAGPAPEAPTHGEPPAAGPEPSPPAAGGATTVSLGKLAEAAALVASAPTTEALAMLRGELVVSLAQAMEIARKAGDVDLMLKTADRLGKYIPATKNSADPAPEPPSGGDHGAVDSGEPTPAERFRIVSGQVGN